MTLTEDLNRISGHEKGLFFVDRREREQRVSWVEMRTKSQAVASSLIELGVQPGQRVALVYRTEEEFFTAFFGCLYARAVPTPLYPPVRLGRLEAYHQRTAGMLKAADAVLVLANGTIRKLLGRAVGEANPPLGCRTLEELPQANHDLPESTEDDLALVQFSSGTTGMPKPVALTHRAIMAQGNVILQTMKKDFPDNTESWRCVCWLPLYHDMGLIGCVVPSLMHRADLVLIRPEDFIAKPALWLRALSRHKGIISTAPNFAYGLCAQRIRDEEIEGIDLSSWEIALNGAEAVRSSTVESFCERFGPYGFKREAMTPVYGLSEAALAVCFSDFKSSYTSGTGADGEEWISLGPPLPGFDVAIRGPNGEELQEGEQGVIWVRGPSLMEGYLNQPEATAKVLHNGWLNTGDVGQLIEGELAIAGRAKDLIILNGRNISPTGIERHLSDIPALREGCVAAVGLPTGDTEALLLLVEHEKTASPEDIDALAELCEVAVLKNTQLSAKAAVLKPGSLPRTSSGKIRRQEALRQFQNGELLPPQKMGALRIAGAMWDSSRHMPKTKTNAPTGSQRVLIVGGGPVGLATAIYARMQGFEAIVFDKRTPPVDKACGEGLMPEGVEALARLGITDLPHRDFSGIYYVQSDRPNLPAARGEFSDGKGWGIRRTALHNALKSRAEAAGAQFRWGSTVTGLTQNGLVCNEEVIEGDWIVGADGLGSQVRKWAGLEGKASKTKRFGIRRHFQCAPWSDNVEVYWAKGCEAYVTPVAEDTVGVAVLWDKNSHKLDLDDLYSPFPELKEKIDNSPLVGPSLGAGPLARRPKSVQDGRVFLVGDAAGYVDALTGEGISLGFQQAEAAIEAMASNRPKRYKKAHRVLVRRPFLFTQIWVWASSRPWLRRGLINGLSKDPVLFGNFLDFMGGRKGWSAINPLRGLRLLLRVLKT